MADESLMTQALDAAAGQTGPHTSEEHIKAVPNYFELTKPRASSSITLAVALLVHAGLLAAAVFYSFTPPKPPEPEPMYAVIIEEEPTPAPPPPQAAPEPPPPPEPKPEPPKPKPKPKPKPVVIHKPAKPTPPRPRAEPEPEYVPPRVVSAPAAAPKPAPRPAPVPSHYLVCPKPTPAYPASSQRNGEEGSVTVMVTVSPGGSVTSAQVVKSSGHSSLDGAALAAARRYHCRASAGGGRGVTTFNFKLES
jgi:protein TonB